MKVYSEVERLALYYEAIPQVGRHASRRHLAEWTQIDDVAISDDADLPPDRSL